MLIKSDCNRHCHPLSNCHCIVLYYRIGPRMIVNAKAIFDYCLEAILPKEDFTASLEKVVAQIIYNLSSLK